MILLSSEEIEELISMGEAVDVMEKAFELYKTESFNMPKRTFSKVKDDDTLLIMPCFAMNSIGIKLVTSFPSNRELGVPVTQGIVTISDRNTGEFKAILNGTLLTALKTGAVSGLGIRKLRPNAQTVGLVGPGYQGLYQLIAAHAVLNLNTIYIYERNPEKTAKFIIDLKLKITSEVDIKVINNIHDLIEKSDIIICATTSNTPVLPDEENIYQNKLIIGVGSYKQNMQELPRKLFENCDYFIFDSRDGIHECGDIINPIKNKWIDKNSTYLLSDLLDNNGLEGTLVFKTVSMALLDTCIGEHIYQKALKSKMGTKFIL